MAEDRQQIIIPWRDAGCIYRKKHFDFLFDYYSQEFDVIVGNNDGEFNRSAARNSGVRESSSEISVIIDADNYISFDQIYAAIKVAKRKDSLVKPFGLFGYLTEEATDSFYSGKKVGDKSEHFIQKPERGFTGGAYVMKKSLWQQIGGMDEGFIGWGAEDDAFHLLVKAKLGEAIYVNGIDLHLYHPAYRVTSEYNYEKLMKEYVNGNIPSRN